MGQAMKTASDSIWHDISSTISRLYITRWKGFNVNKTLVLNKKIFRKIK